MNTGDTAVTAAPLSDARRSDAGTVRLTARDITGLVLAGEMHGAPYDLLAAYLDVREDRLRSIISRWRNAGYAQTGRLGPGPAWVWLTRSGLAVTGLGFPSEATVAGPAGAPARDPGRPPVNGGRRRLGCRAGALAQ